MKHPYKNQPDKAFWRRAVADRHYSAIQDLAPDLPDFENTSVATAGSCFAQHIGRAMRSVDLSFLDLEPAPAILSKANANRLGYGLFSCRYGNIYTSRQLCQLFDEAHGLIVPQDGIWKAEGRFFDALRPGIEPEGFSSPEEVKALRKAHLECVRKMFAELDVFVFTLGLTETWVSSSDGTAYPIAPGVIAGKYKPGKYRFVNLRYPDILADMTRFRENLKSVNPGAQILLTVSPVPLAATAGNEHVLSATTYSKSVLRAVAGDLAHDFEDVTYFPSYEIITGQPYRHGFYEPDLRSVATSGVAEVMSHLFPEITAASWHIIDQGEAADDFGYEHCEEGLLTSD